MRYCGIWGNLGWQVGATGCAVGAPLVWAKDVTGITTGNGATDDSVSVWTLCLGAPKH